MERWLCCWSRLISSRFFLAALIPPPNFHMVRYHGVLAANAKARAQVVPGPVPEPSEPTQMPLLFEGETSKPPTKRPARRTLGQGYCSECSPSTS